MRTIENNSGYMQMLIHGRLSPTGNSKGIRGSDWNWIDNDDIRCVCLRLLVIASINKAWIDGICMVKMTQRLIGCEVRPGGPYVCEDGRVDLFLNGVIAQLFRQLNVPLFTLESFVILCSKGVKLSPGETVFLEWILSHPGKLQSNGKVLQGEVVGRVFFEVKQWFARPRAILGMLTDTSMTRVRHGLERENPSKVTLGVKREIDQQYKNSNLYSGMIRQWRLVAEADKNHEISTLSSYFMESVKKESAEFKGEKVKVCNMANFYTWMAYSIYDDFLDESPNKENLLIANTAYRHALSLYCEVVSERELRKLFQMTDEANYIEVKHMRCKIKNGFIYIRRHSYYENIDQVAHKSIAHITGPIAMTASMKVTQRQKELIEGGLLHYLIARQLNDDVHDWVEDIKRGHISYVVCELLLALDITPGKYELALLVSRMKKYFWGEGLIHVCGQVLRNIEHARDKFEETELFMDNNSFYEKIIDPIEKAAWVGVVKYAEQKKFISHYVESSTK